MTEMDAQALSRQQGQLLATLTETNTILGQINASLYALAVEHSRFAAMAEAVAVTMAEKHGLNLAPVVAARKEAMEGEGSEPPEKEVKEAPMTPAELALRDMLGPELYEQQKKDGLI